MKTLLFISLLALCLLVVHGEKKADKAKAETPKAEDKAAEKTDAKEQKKDETKSEDEDEDEEEADEVASDDASGDSDKGEVKKEFSCNLKYQRIGCYADKGKKERPLSTFMMSDVDMGTTTKKGELPATDKFNTELPKFACKCANEALTSGNAVFGLQNIAECWSGPDDSKYDKDGPSDDCVTYDFAACAAESEVCSGKKNSNFVYYIDAPDHNKTKEEEEKELVEEKKKEDAAKKKKEKADKAKKSKSKKSKKAKN